MGSHQELCDLPGSHQKLCVTWREVTKSCVTYWEVTKSCVWLGGKSPRVVWLTGKSPEVVWVGGKSPIIVWLSGKSPEVVWLDVIHGNRQHFLNAILLNTCAFLWVHGWAFAQDYTDNNLFKIYINIQYIIILCMVTNWRHSYINLITDISYTIWLIQAPIRTQSSHSE